MSHTLQTGHTAAINEMVSHASSLADISKEPVSNMKTPIPNSIVFYKFYLLFFIFIYFLPSYQFIISKSRYCSYLVY